MIIAPQRAHCDSRGQVDDVELDFDPLDAQQIANGIRLLGYVVEGAEGFQSRDADGQLLGAYPKRPDAVAAVIAAASGDRPPHAGGHHA